MTAGERHDAYAHLMDAPMLLLALVFLGVWSITSIDTDMPLEYGNFLFYVNGFIWLLFIVDLAIRIVLAQSSWHYLTRHPLDVLAVTVPMLRPLKVLTVFSSGRGLITSRGAVRTVQAIVASAAVLIWVGAVSVLNFEINAPGASITSFGDALWWALSTVTTVGYGDFVPITVGGRIVAAGLMVVGIAIVGVVTAWVAAWFIKYTTTRDSEAEMASIASSAADVRKLRQEIERLEAELDAKGERPGRDAR